MPFVFALFGRVAFNSGDAAVDDFNARDPWRAARFFGVALRKGRGGMAGFSNGCFGRFGISGWSMDIYASGVTGYRSDRSRVYKSGE